MSAVSVPAPDAPRLHIVTGKGGTGKTTVAAAMAVALSRRGKVLLCEVEGRSGIARLFDADTLPYAETRVARTDDGEIYALPIDPSAALEEYISDYLHMGAATKVLERVGALDFVTTVAPGLRDVVLGGKVYEATRRTDRHRSDHRADPHWASEFRIDPHRSGRFAYDAVVLDAPPTGRIARFLGASGEVAELARKGPIRAQADSIVRMLTSATTVLHMVTTAEEMPVQEAMDGVGEVRAAGITVGTVVLNARRPPLLDERARAQLADPASIERLAQELSRTGLADGRTAAPTALAADLRTEGLRHLQRLELEQRLLAELSTLGAPIVQLPWLPEGIDAGSLRALARELLRSGAVA